MAEKLATKPRALIVDDDPVVRVMVQEALANEGFEIEESESGEEALQLAECSRFDLVILDLELPGIDGFETCRRLRRLPSAGETTVVVSTAHTDASTIDRAFEVGANDFLKKPPDWQLLQYRIRFLMHASRAASRLNRTLRELEESQRRLNSAQHLARIGTWEWTAGTKAMRWSPELYCIAGAESDASTMVRDLIRLVHPEERDAVTEALRHAMQQGKAWSFDHRLVTTSGEIRIVHHQAEVAATGEGGPTRLLGTLQDVTDRKQAEERIRQLAYYDSLTGLPNRRMLQQRLRGTLERARAVGEAVALLFIDLDRFKRINDTLGHVHGDVLLKQVAERLIHCVRSSDQVGRSARKRSVTVSRLGGDEFTILLDGIRSPEDGALVAKRVLAALQKPFELGDRKLVTGASVGIALYPVDGGDVDTLLRNADAAMYAAKRAGRNTYRFFDTAMNDKALRSLQVEEALRSSLGTGQLELFFQPQWNPRSGGFEAVEALARWESPELGSVSPSEFIPVAEESELIEPLGEWVLRTACQQMCAWDEEGLAPLRLGVNVSRRELSSPDGVARIARILDETGLSPDRLELELTENALLGDEAEMLRKLEELKRLGVRLALDDFGTGYSSLSHLDRFPIDAVQIDRSFVTALGTGRKPGAVVAAIVSMAHQLHLSVTAEGVETEQQEHWLGELGCDLLQGYRIGRPARAAELTERLRRGRE